MLLGLLLAILLVLHLLGDISSRRLEFSVVSNNNPWDSRFKPHVHTLQYNLSHNGTTYPKGSFLLYGGSDDVFLHSVINDVWLSSNQGRSWSNLIIPENSIFARHPVCSFCHDPKTDRSYAITNNEDGYTDISSVWSSTTQDNWTSVTPGILSPSSGSFPFLDRYGSNCIVGQDSKIYYLLGVNRTKPFVAQIGYNDAWSSNDHGANWNLRLDKAPFESRFNSITGIDTKNRHFGGADILYIMGGLNSKNEEINDLWISSDQAANWAPLSRPPWDGITSQSAMHITEDGVLVANVYALGVSEQTSDVWISLDGGYFWSLCIHNASYGARFLPGLVMDTSGFLYVIGGFGPNSGFYNDIWKSSIRISNLTELADACNTTIPEDGVGLSRWPSRSESSSSGGRISSSSTPTGASSLTSEGGRRSSSTGWISSSSILTGGSFLTSDSWTSSSSGPEFRRSDDRQLVLGLIIGGCVLLLLVVAFLAYITYLKRKYGKIKWVCCDQTIGDNLEESLLVNR